ncbi:MAG: hypothetical protein BGO98_43340 [Myxococcales bacterium 68-20]|nr:MAG: hypothetical protein BGO98_43340 [Myxococcales bacterium 68-20]
MLEGAPDDEARLEQRDTRVCPLEIARHVSSRRAPTPERALDEPRTALNLRRVPDASTVTIRDRLRRPRNVHTST